MWLLSTSFKGQVIVWMAQESMPEPGELRDPALCDASFKGLPRCGSSPQSQADRTRR